MGLELADQPGIGQGEGGLPGQGASSSGSARWPTPDKGTAGDAAQVVVALPSWATMLTWSSSGPRRLPGQHRGRAVDATRTQVTPRPSRALAAIAPVS